VLLLCEPTRGVDVGAKAEIYRLLMRFASAGGTAMIFSSDPEEIVAVCDRAYVVRQGQLSKPLVTGSFDVDQLTELAM
jgi:ABC-type sugar transport system ATPase subunit